MTDDDVTGGALSQCLADGETLGGDADIGGVTAATLVVSVTTRHVYVICVTAPVTTINAIAWHRHYLN